MFSGKLFLRIPVNDNRRNKMLDSMPCLVNERQMSSSPPGVAVHRVRSPSEESPDQRGPIQAAPDAIRRLGEVARRVLPDIDMVIGAPDRGLKVGDDGIDPAERSDLAGSERTDHDRPVGGDVRTGSAEAREGVGDAVRLGIQCLVHLGTQRAALAMGQQIKTHVSGITAFIQLHRGDDRGVAFGASSARAGAALAPTMLTSATTAPPRRRPDSRTAITSRCACVRLDEIVAGVRGAYRTAGAEVGTG